MYSIANKFNCGSTAEYFISYKRPKAIIEKYKFQVQLVTQLLTNMHCSGEGHTCYIFRRVGKAGLGATDQQAVCFGVPCDPLFQAAYEACRLGGFDAVNNHVAAKVDQFYNEKPKRECIKPNRLSPTF